MAIIKAEISVSLKSLKVLGRQIKIMIKEAPIKCLKTKNLLDSIKEALEIKDSRKVIQEYEKTIAAHKFNACYKSFKKIKDFENHVESKHNENTYNYCNNIVRSNQHLVRHHHECLDIGVQKVPVLNVMKNSLINI